MQDYFVPNVLKYGIRGDNMKSKLLILIIALIGLCVSGCATNPVTGEDQFMIYSQSSEANIGKQYAPEIEKQLHGKLDDAGIQNYVNSVGQKIAKVSHMPNLKFKYTVVNHDMINAMALPGGYIFITRGMLEKLNSEAQLAGILAHETVHVTARHSAASMSRQVGINVLMNVAINEKTPETAARMAYYANQLLGLRYSRSQELEADQYGMDYMVKAGYDPAGIIETMQILEREGSGKSIEFLSTHPNPGNRVEELTRHMNLKGYNYSAQGLRVGNGDFNANVLGPLKRIPPVKGL